MPRAYRFSVLQLACLLLLTCFASHAQDPTTGSPEIAFTVLMSKPYTHLLEVQIDVRQATGRMGTDLVMPVWTPGSYLIREFERHVQDFAADSNGRALDWTKVNKHTWRVRTNGARAWRVSYRVYANELSVRTSEVNSDHAFWNNAALLMYPEGQISAPSILRIGPAPGWKIA